MQRSGVWSPPQVHRGLGWEAAGCRWLPASPERGSRQQPLPGAVLSLLPPQPMSQVNMSSSSIHASWVFSLTPHERGKV